MANRSAKSIDNRRKQQAERMRRIRAEEAEIGDIPPCLNPGRRKACAASLRMHALTYHEDIFYNPITDEQAEDFKTMEYAIRNGGLFALGAPRGDGKTTRFDIGLEWAVINGYSRYGVLITAESSSADEAIDFFKMQFETNELLLEDYPEICVPVRMLEGSSGRAKAQTINGERTHLKFSKNKIILPTIAGSVSAGSVITVTSIEGRIRGMKHQTAGGETIRPDFVLIDDPQTRETASSAQQIKKRMDIIKGDVLGLAGQGKEITCVMACTIIQKYDLAYRMLDRSEHPEWQGVLRKMFTTFPDDMEFWESEYHEAYLKSLELQDSQKYANEFYIANRERLEAGASMNNPHRKGDNDITSIQHAMHLYFKFGRAAFMAEYQNEPQTEEGVIYELNPSIVRGRVNGYERGEVPPQAKFITVMADVNYIGLNWCCTAFDNDFTSWIIDYGKYPGGANVLFDPEKDGETSAAQAISNGIVFLCKFFAEKKYSGEHIDLLMFDGNFNTETVCKTIEAVRKKMQLPFKVLVHRGRSHKYYKVQKTTVVGKPGDECHIENTPQRGIQIIQNSDYWRMAAQKAFLHEPGVPGSCSLWGNRPIEHDNFAREVCAERLDNYAITDKGAMYVWNIQPGQPNDKLDALVGTYSGASMLGCSFIVKEERKNREQRRKPKPMPSSKAGGSIRRKY